MWKIVGFVCLYLTNLYDNKFIWLNIQQHFSFVQLWDLDNILQDSRSTARSETGVVDNEVDSDDNDGMDIDNNRSKSSKGRIW
jgi:hypothetical protein